MLMNLISSFYVCVFAWLLQFQSITEMLAEKNNILFCLQVRELNVEAAKLTSSHPNAAQDIEWKRHELEEAWANLREQVFDLILFIFTIFFSMIKG